MYRKPNVKKTSINLNQSSEGESIEQKIDRILTERSPISDGAPIIHTERKEGVMPGYDIRTDRFDVAIDAMDKVAGSHRAKREARLTDTEDPKIKKMDTGGDVKDKPVGGHQE